MLFENNDFIDTMATFGLDMSNFVDSVDNGKDHFEEHHYQDHHNYSGGRFCSSEEGFLKGSLYKREYKPYKNMTYLSKEAKNEKEALMFKLYEYNFAITDLNFWLDLNSDDREAFMLFKNYVQKFEHVKKEYERRYGPLFVSDADDQVFDWVDNPWPWDKDRGSMYV